MVDDERTSVEVISRFLGMKGHRVLGAGSAEEAAALLRAGPVDLVLMDIVLPGRTGLQALAEFKTLTKAPIYLMSGGDEQESRKDALLLGARGFFVKPMDLAEVAAVLEALP